MSTSTLDFQIKDDGKQVKGFFEAVKNSIDKAAKSFSSLFGDAANKSLNTTAKAAQQVDKDFSSLIKRNQELVKNFGALKVATGIAAASFGVLMNIGDWKEFASTVIGGVGGMANAFNELDRAYALMQAEGFNTQAIEDLRLMGEVFKLNAAAAEEFAQRAVAAFDDYGAALTRVNTLEKLNKEQLGAYGSELQDLVTDKLKNAVTSTEALAGQYEVLSAGFSKANGAQDVLTAGLKLATAGQADQGETLRLLVKTMQAYKISAADAGKTAAVLNGIVEQGITTVPELTQGFGQTATVAKEAGIKIEELGAAVALLTTKGTNTPSALTGVESLSSVIIDKTPEASKALAELRDQAGKPIKFDIAEIKAKGLTKALRDLNEAIGGNAQKLAEIIPESRAYSTALALMSNNVKDFEDMTVKLGEVTAKSLDDVFGISLGDNSKKFTQIINRFGEVLIKFGQAIAPAFEAGIDALDSISQFLIDMPDWLKTASVSFVLFGLGITKVTGALGSLSGMLFKLATIYLSNRAVNLLLNGTLMDQVNIVKRLVDAKAGLLPVLKQILGFNQEYILYAKEQAEIDAKSIKNTTAMAEAIENQAAVIKAKKGVDKAQTEVDDSEKKFRKAADLRAQLESTNAQLLNEQAKTRRVLLDEASKYEEKLAATNKLALIEQELQRGSQALEKSRQDERKKLNQYEADFIKLKQSEAGLAGAKDTAGAILEQKVKAKAADEAATLAQRAAEEDLLRVEDLATKQDIIRSEIRREKLISKEASIKASKLEERALAQEAKAEKLAITLGEQAEEVTKRRNIAQKLRERATLEASFAEDTAANITALQNEYLQVNTQKEAAATVAKTSRKAAITATTRAETANIAVAKTALMLERERLIAEGKLIQTRLVGQTFYVKSAGLIGSLNRLLVGEVSIKKVIAGLDRQDIALKDVISKKNIVVAASLKALSIAQGSITVGFAFVKKAAETAWTAILGPLAPIIALIGAVVSALAVLWTSFSQDKSISDMTSKMKELNTEMDSTKEKLSESSAAWKQYSNEVKEQDAFSVIASNISNFIDGVVTSIKDKFAPVFDFIEYIQDVVGKGVENVAKMFGPLEGVVKGFLTAVTNPMKFFGDVWDNFTSNGVVTAMAEIDEAVQSSGGILIEAIKTTKSYNAGIYATVEANEKLRKGLNLTAEDLQKENEVFTERKKLIESEVAANEKRIEAINKLIEEKGKDSDRGKELAGERDNLNAVNEKLREYNAEMDKAKQFLDALTDARAKANKNKMLNENEIIDPAAVEAAKKQAAEVQESLRKTLGENSKYVTNMSQDAVNMSESDLSRLKQNVKQTAETIKSGMLPVQEAVKKAGIDFNRLTGKQIDAIKSAMDSGSITKINEALSSAAESTKQDFTKLNSEQKDALLSTYKQTKDDVAKINQSALDEQVTQFSIATDQFSDLKKKASATLQTDIGATAFQTQTNKALRFAKEEYDDYLKQYKASIEGQVDATGKLYYVTAENQKNVDKELNEWKVQNAELASKDVQKYNEALASKSKEIAEKYKSDITLTADQIKQGYQGKIDNLVQQANQAVESGGKTAGEAAKMLRDAREALGDLLTPEQNQEFSQSIIDLEKDASSQKQKVWTDESARLNAMQDARLVKESEVQTKILELQKKQMDENIDLKKREIEEYKRQGMTTLQQQAERDLTLLQAQQSALRLKISDNEVDRKYEKQKEGMQNQLKLLDMESETRQMVAQQEEKLAKSRMDVARAQADLEISRIQRSAKYMSSESGKARVELEIVEKQNKLNEKKFDMERQSLKVQNMMNTIAADRTKIQIELNKLELEGAIIKAKTALSQKDISAEQKAALESQIKNMEAQKGKLDEQGKAAEASKKSQAEITKNAEKELGLRQQASKEQSAADKKAAQERIQLAKIEDKIAMNSLRSETLDKRIELINRFNDIQEQIQRSRLNLARTEIEYGSTALQIATKLSGGQQLAALADLRSKKESIRIAEAESKIEREQLVRKNKTIQIEAQKQAMQAQSAKLQIDLEIIKIRTEMQSAKLTADELKMTKEKLGLLQEQAGIAAGQIKLADVNAKAQEEIIANSMKELDMKQSINKQNAEADVILARRQADEAKLNTLLEQRTALAEVENKASELRSKSLEGQNSIIERLLSTAKADYSLAENSAQTETRKRKIRREMLDAQIAALDRQAEIELALFDIQQKQNKLARERLKIETDIAIIKSKAEADAAKAAEKAILANAKSTKEEREAATANRTAKEQLYAANLQTKDIVAKSGIVEETVAEMTRKAMVAAQNQADRQLKAERAQTTVSIADDMRVGREARNAARQGMEEVNKVIKDFALATPSAPRNNIVSTNVQMGGFNPGVSSELATGTPANVLRTNAEEQRTREEKQVGEINITNQIEINLAPGESNPKGTADTVREEILKTLDDVVSKTKGLLK